MDGVEEGLRKMKIKKWWSATESWRKILRETEAHSGLQAHDDDDDENFADRKGMLEK
jgi:hypothetical protein